MKNLLRLLFVVGVFASLGYVSSCAGPENTCVANVTQACTCGTQIGIQTCKADGTGFDPCVCASTEKVVSTEPGVEPAGPEPTGPEPAGPEPAGPEPAGPEPTGPEPTGPEPAKDASTGTPEVKVDKGACDPKTHFIYAKECFSSKDFCLGQTTNPNFPQFRSKFTKDAVSESYKIVFDPNTKEPFFCETKPGYYYLPGFGYGICDNDNDGWININAFRAVDSTDAIIKTNARCTLLKVGAVEYQKNDYAQKEGTSNTSYHHFPNPVALVETIRNDGLDDLIKMPVYTKDQAPLPTTTGFDCNADLTEVSGKKECPVGKTCCVDGKICYIGHCVVGRRFEAKEINTLTKACIAGIDLNDNQLNDANERPSDTPNPASEFEPLLKFGYFFALHYGYVQTELVIPDPTDPKKNIVKNVFRMFERSRLKTTGYQYIKLQAKEDPNGFQPDYWRSCGLRDDQQCTGASGKIRKGLSSCWLKDIKRGIPSLFKCVTFDSNTNKSLQEGFFHPDNYSAKYDRTTCSFDSKHTAQQCILKGCGTDADCLGNETCRAVTVVLKQCHPKKTCARSADCGPNQYCRNKKCFYKSTSCFSNKDCPSGVGQTCGIQKLCLLSSCVQDSDCKATEECRNNVCHPSKACTTTTDCGTGHLCVQKKCLSLVIPCKKNSECGNNRCEAPPSLQYDVLLSCNVDDGTKKPNPARKEVGWAVVRFAPYATKEDYLAGCIDEKAEQVCGDPNEATNLADNLIYLNHEVGSYGKIRAKKECGVKVGKGECRAAEQTCSSGAWFGCPSVAFAAKCRTCPQATAGQRKACPGGVWPTDSCKPVLTPQPETCDGKDNDCDGQVDEIATCTCPLNSTRPCGISRGVCKQGTQTCIKSGASTKWGPCGGGYVGPINEICDGRDNDCDGQVDESIQVHSFYKDADGDSYGDKTLAASFRGCYQFRVNGRYCDAVTHKCAAIPPGYVINRSDCCDKDKNVRPNQGLYFASPNLCGNFDYNCDGRSTPERTLCNCSNQVSFYNEPDAYAYRSYAWQGGNPQYLSGVAGARISPSPYKNTTSCELDGNAKVTLEPSRGFSHYVYCRSNYAPRSTCSKTTTISPTSNVSWWNSLKKSTTFPRDGSNINYLMWQKSQHRTGCLFKLNGTRPTCGDRTSYAAPGISASTLRFPKTKIDAQVLYLDDFVGCGRCSGCCPVAGYAWHANRIKYRIHLKWQYRTYSSYVFTSKPNSASIVSVKCR